MLLTSGVAIESYPDDSPYPSALWLGQVDARPLHVVCAENSPENERIIVTVYEPDAALWEAGFAKRRSS